MAVGFDIDQQEKKFPVITDYARQLRRLVAAVDS